MIPFPGIPWAHVGHPGAYGALGMALIGIIDQPIHRSQDEVVDLYLHPEINVIKIITARDMNEKQRKLYSSKRGR